MSLPYTEEMVNSPEQISAKLDGQLSEEEVLRIAKLFEKSPVAWDAMQKFVGILQFDARVRVRARMLDEERLS